MLGKLLDDSANNISSVDGKLTTIAPPAETAVLLLGGQTKLFCRSWN